MMRSYSAKVHRLAYWTMLAMDRLDAQCSSDCECDVDFCCETHERHQRIATRYAIWRDTRSQRCALRLEVG